MDIQLEYKLVLFSPTNGYWTVDVYFEGTRYSYGRGHNTQQAAIKEAIDWLKQHWNITNETPASKSKPANSVAPPKNCPRCSSPDYIVAVEWFAHSMDPQDLHNTAVLSEFQCETCGRSWWQ